MICPCCGAKLTYSKDKTLIICEFCGHEERTAAIDTGYNMTISVDTGVQQPVLISIPDARISNRIPGGSTVTYKLAPGPHNIQIARGSKNNDCRLVVISDIGEIVKMRIDSVNTKIDQPYAGEKYKTLEDGLFPNTTKGLSIAALILAFIPFCASISIILASIDMSVCRKNNRKVNPMSPIALSVAIMALMIWLSIIARGAQG